MICSRAATPVPGKKLAGFTLIELMIVVAIISILAMIALPSYDKYVIRSNRAIAKQLMLNIANREEQYMLDARAYTTVLDASTNGLNIKEQGWTCTPTQCSTNRYQVSVAVVAAAPGTPPAYTITATAIGQQVSDGWLKLDNLGQKTSQYSDKW